MHARTLNFTSFTFRLCVFVHFTQTKNITKDANGEPFFDRNGNPILVDITEADLEAVFDR